MSSPSLPSTSSTPQSLIASPSSSSQNSSSSEHVTEPGYSFVFSPFLQHKSSRIIPGTGPQQNRRKRDLLDTGPRQQSSLGYLAAAKMNQFREPLVMPTPSPGSCFGPSGKLKAKQPKSYSTGEELFAALANTCMEDQVDFSGSYLVRASDADNISDKQRVQKVANAIWKATGYRFTVKDHPPTDRGHKTRLWCSQDEARRSKHRTSTDAPRLSKQGELFAKQRYPCRSRLMIACLPEGARGTRIVTVRMHHYVRHETYLEGEGATAAATPSASPTVPLPLLTTQFLNAISVPLPPHLTRAHTAPVAPPPALHEREGVWDASHPEHLEFQQELPPEPALSASPSPHPPFTSAPPTIVEQHAHRPQFPHVPQPPPPPTMAEQHAHHHHHAHLLAQQQPYQLPSSHTHPHAQSSPHSPPGSAPPPLLQGTPSQLTIDEFEHRMRTHIARIRDFCDGLEYQVQFGDIKMLEALERDAVPFLRLRDACLGEEGR